MKYVINPDLAWQRANAFHQMFAFVGYMTYAGHPHINCSFTNYWMTVTVFMKPEDNVDDILEISTQSLHDEWTHHEERVFDENGLTRWITFEYQYNK